MSSLENEVLSVSHEQRKKTEPAVGNATKTFILVSGLPRSGTSLMMQMIEAGGIAVMTDHLREPDRDNPRGYYEWEAIKEIARRPDLLDGDEVNGRAIKCISALLPSLPLQHRYKVIFMLRPIAEVAASQSALLARKGKKGTLLDSAQMEGALRAHREEIRAWAMSRSNLDWLEISYPELVRDPGPTIARLAEFIGAENLPDRHAMAAVICPSLHHYRI